MITIKRLLPSTYIKHDPQSDFESLTSTIRPILLNNLKLISSIKDFILSYRHQYIPHIRDNTKKATVLIPYRHRESQKEYLIPYLHKYLTEQKISFEIILIEQADNEIPFNKGQLFNIGSTYASKDTDYFILHDVDMVPEDIDYTYCNHPFRPFNYIYKESEPDMHYKKTAEERFGGVVFVTKQDYFNVNGFSNRYWHWGSEDDDFFFRLLLKGLIPYMDENGKYRELFHEKSVLQTPDGTYQKNPKIIKELTKLRKKNRNRFSDLKRGISDPKFDGVEQISYPSITIEQFSDYKHLKVHLYLQ